MRICKLCQVAASGFPYGGTIPDPCVLSSNPMRISSGYRSNSSPEIILVSFRREPQNEWKEAPAKFSFLTERYYTAFRRYYCFIKITKVVTLQQYFKHICSIDSFHLKSRTHWNSFVMTKKYFLCLGKHQIREFLFPFSFHYSLSPYMSFCTFLNPFSTYVNVYMYIDTKPCL